MSLVNIPDRQYIPATPDMLPGDEVEKIYDNILPRVGHNEFTGEPLLNTPNYLELELEQLAEALGYSPELNISISEYFNLISDDAKAQFVEGADLESYLALLKCNYLHQYVLYLNVRGIYKDALLHILDDIQNQAGHISRILSGYFSYADQYQFSEAIYNECNSFTYVYERFGGYKPVLSLDDAHYSGALLRIRNHIDGLKPNIFHPGNLEDVVDTLTTKV